MLNTIEIPKNEKKIVGIYSLLNLNNGRVYVGRSSNIIKRATGHRSALVSGKHVCREMQADYLNGDQFVFSIIRTFDCSDPDYLNKLLCTYEYEEIKSHEPDKLYNKDIDAPYLWQTVMTFPKDVRPDMKYHAGDIFNPNYKQFVISENQIHPNELEHLTEWVNSMLINKESDFIKLVKSIFNVCSEERELMINKLINILQ